ncbi:uncharacterized protein LOC114515730 [Dendronephthya gigantea]|uniref:uncharacterized protein LOC114515730 n=1 Tax=Dendronephthya gigantea TaxID=151771 RepID=UPI00106D9728|nr:uncharacterized protein LOC114515730 [Dendronephthya gigantea]
MYKVFLLAFACLILAEARRFEKIWSRNDSFRNKRLFGPIQVCRDLQEEKVVKTSTLVNSAGNLHPPKILTVRCRKEDGIARGVNDPSIICKTKTKSFEVVEYDDQGTLITPHTVDVPVDCIAYKIV